MNTDQKYSLKNLRDIEMRQSNAGVSGALVGIMMGAFSGFVIGFVFGILL